MWRTRDDFRSFKTLSKVNLDYSKAEFKEAKFHWGLKRFKTEKKERLTISEGKL